MAIEINWGLLQPVDIGGQFTQGLERGRQQARERAVEGALSDLMPAMVGGGLVENQNPEYQQRKQRALGALAMYAPDRFAAYSKFEAAQREERIAQQARQRQTALGELYTKDPQGAITEATAAGDLELAKQFQALDETQRKAVAARYQSAAPIAYQIAKMPYEQRKAAIQSQAPALMAGGWTPEQIAGFDPTDEALGGLVSSALSVEKLMERDKITWHQQGEQPSFATDSMGRPVGSQNPYAVGNRPPTATGGTTGGNASGIISKNNPGALRKPGSMEFQTFATPQEGVAAQEALLGRYHGRGLNTVSKVVETYAPRSSRGGDNTDAQVNNYISYVSGRLGINPNDPIPASAVPKLAEAMREFETGNKRPPRSQVAAKTATPAVTVISKAAFDALPKGTRFIAPDGTERIKP